MKKFIYCFLMLVASNMLFVSNASAAALAPYEGPAYLENSVTSDYDRDDDFTTNCQDFAPTIRMGGYLIFLVKILLPLIIIVKTTLNILPAITKGAPDELKKVAKKATTSLIAAIIIFFIPTLLNVIFGFVSGFNENVTTDSKICTACIFEPFGNTCKTYAE